jgi:hypothetical protein
MSNIYGMMYVVQNTYIVPWFDMFNVTCVTYWTNKVTDTTTIIKIDEDSDWISRRILILYEYCFYFYAYFNRCNILPYDCFL